ncbi:hypothetical protein OROGR_017005 [Orobanche gracilis]
MAKKVVSVALHPKKTKKKPIKHISKTGKLKTLLRNVLCYLKSDTYMFARLFYPHSSRLKSSPDSSGEMFFEPMNKKEKKNLAKNVKDYLKCDCYMYAPILVLKDTVADSATLPLGDQCGKTAGVSSDVGDQMELRMEETTMNSSREVENEDISNPTRRIVVERNMLQRETVKHVVHQNCRTPSSPVPAKSVVAEKASFSHGRVNLLGDRLYKAVLIEEKCRRRKSLVKS